MAERVNSHDAAADVEPASGQAGLAFDDDGGYREAFDRAVRLLAQREHSLRELKDKLARKGVDREMAALVADDVRGRGLQSDQRFAEALVRSRVSRGHGPVRIRRELAQRGIDEGVADEVLTATGAHWIAQAVQARVRKFGEDLPADRDAWNRQARFLAQRGFPSDLIYRVLEGRAD